MNTRRRRAARLLATAICALAFPSVALAARSEGRGGGGGAKHYGGGRHGDVSRGHRSGGGGASRGHAERQHGRRGGGRQHDRRDGGRQHDRRDGGHYGGRQHDRRDGGPSIGRHTRRDSHGPRRHYYGHARHAYPRHGHRVYRLPRNYFTITLGGYSHYYYGGVWYRPYRYGFGYVVAVAPLGAVISVLPPYYTTIWVGDVPYYYANSVYYRWSPPDDGYVVVEDPGVGVPENASDELFIYPNADQSEEQQADDRYACHRWAAEQTGYDPSLGTAAEDESRQPGLRSDYLRAMSACLEGRDYTVK